MTGIFGQRWLSSYGVEPSETWLAGLIDMEPGELQIGLVACLSWESDWPPTLPQFRALCRPRRDECHRVYRAQLPEPAEVRSQRLESGRVVLDSLRAMLGPSDDEPGRAPVQRVSADVMQQAIAELAELAARLE